MSDLTGIKLPETEELIERINSQLGGVEDIIDFSEKFKDVYIVKVVSCEKHPDADRLSVCKVDDGGQRHGVERDENGLVTVVCGAPNVHSDMFAAWLPPESVVPATSDDDNPFRLDARKLRGIMSNGMLAAGDELDINSDHEGIVEISQKDLKSGMEIKSGIKFADVFDLNDTIIDIENKMFTHRPDLFGQIGVAREIFAILNNSKNDDTSKSFKEFDWYKNNPEFEKKSDIDFVIKNEVKDKVYNFVGIAFDDIKVEKSPLWLQIELHKFGIKPVNNIVDITNYAMIMTAQPIHAYDLDKIDGDVLIARKANDEEKIKLLDGKEYSLSESDIVIADNSKVLGLGGIMGGFDSQVDDKTKRIAIEVATFDMYSIRRSSMKHGLFTDAVTRFNKGQSPYQNERVLKYTSKLIEDITNSNRSSSIISDDDVQYSQKSIKINAEFINKRLGTNFELSDIAAILSLVNFEIDYISDKSIEIKIPFWRMDIEIKEDVVEEVGRIYGFDKIKKSLPNRSIKPANVNLFRRSKKVLSEKMLELGANELLTYSFVNKKVIEKSGQNIDNCFELSNALSPDLQCYRLSILPSLLDKVHSNIKAGNDNFVIYEIGKSHNVNEYNDEKLPLEHRLIDGVLASKNSINQAPFFEIKSFVSDLYDGLNVKIKFSKIEKESELMKKDCYVMFDEKRSASIIDESGDVVGVLGEFKKSVVKNFKLPEYCAGFSIDFDKLVRLISGGRVDYRPLNKFPSITNDLSIKVNYDMEYETIHSLLIQKSRDYKSETIDIKPISIFTPEDKTFKTFTFRITISNDNKTLKTKEANKITSELEEFVLKNL